MSKHHKSGEDEKFHPKDAVGSALQGFFVTGVAGAFVSGVQNALAKQNYGVWGAVTRTGGTIAIFASMGGTYTFVREASANLREKNDGWNPAIGGFFAGGLLGLRYRAFPPVLGYGVGLAALMAAFDRSGGSLKGAYKQLTMDEVARKEYIRTNLRKPFEETIEEVGEGRGIYGPGYAERRRKRILDKYGIEVPVPESTSS